MPSLLPQPGSSKDQAVTTLGDLMRSLTLSLSLLLAACGVDHSNADAGTDAPASASGGYSFGSTGSGSSGGSSDTDATDTDTEDTNSDTDTVEDTDAADTDCDESTWYADNDGDGFGAAAYSTWSCDQPTGYVSNDDDLDDGLAVVGSTPTPAMICATVDVSYEFAFWWDDTDLSESNTWLNTTVTDTTAACEEVADFRPTHLFALNGYYKGGGNEDEWLVGAGNTSHITNVYVMFEDGSFDEYTVDSTGTYTTSGYAYFVDNGAGGGNLYFEAEPDFVGEHSH